jgi:hypothetical protein
MAQADDDAPGWEDLLANLGLDFYFEKLHEAAIDTPAALAAMGHDDAMSILKELEVLPGHRHRLVKACLDPMPKGDARAQDLVYDRYA